MKRKLLSIALALTMALGLLPAAALAEGEGASSGRVAISTLTKNASIDGDKGWYDNTNNSKYLTYEYYSDADKMCYSVDNKTGASTQPTSYDVHWVKSVTITGIDFGELTDTQTASEDMAALKEVIMNGRRTDTSDQFKDSIEVKFVDCSFNQTSSTLQVYKIMPCNVTKYTFEECTFNQAATGQYAVTLNVAETGYDSRAISYEITGSTITSAERGINIIPGTETTTLGSHMPKVVISGNTFTLPTTDSKNMAVQIAGNWDNANLNTNSDPLIQIENNNITAYAVVRIHSSMSGNTGDSAKYIARLNNNKLTGGTIDVVSDGDDATVKAIAEYYTAVVNNDFAAEINGVQYPTLAAAYAAATGGTEIKLLKDAENVELAGQSGIMVTIDLNGHNLTGKITKDHDLTIKDGSEGASGAAHFNYVQCNVLKLDGGNVIIDDAKIHHTVQITGANVTINGGEYQLGTGYTAAINKTTGKLTVNSGRFWTRDNLESGDTEVVSYTDETNATRYTVGKTTQGGYTVKKAGSNGDLYFYDLTTAALAAQDGDTITLLADQTITAPVVVNNSVTIDGGGYNIKLGDSLKTAGIVNSYAHGVFQFKGDGKTAAVRNFAFADIEINTVLLRAYNSGSNSTLTVEDCSFTNIKVMNVIRAASSEAASSRLVVNNCTFESCTASSNGIIQIDSSSTNAVSEIGNSDFIGNETGISKNVAVVYLSAPAKVENNYFKDNTTRADGSTKNGIVVTGSNAGGSVIQENAFVSHHFADGDAMGAIYGAKGETKVSKNYYHSGIQHLVKQDNGFDETDSSTVYLKEIGKPGVKTDLTGVSLTAGTYEYPGDDFSTLVASGYRAAKIGDVWTVSKISSSSGSSTSAVTVSKADNGTVTVTPSRASKGDTVTVTVKPDSGYVLETLTVTDRNGNELKLTDKGDGKYTFTMPSGAVTVKAAFMEDNSVLNFFYDVPNDAYYYEAVKWAVDKGITSGIGNNLFGSDASCTRAQIVTFLWRAAGSPEPKGTSSFTDVSADAYYAKAVAWAVENGVTAGIGDGLFGSDNTCTRAQSVTFLFKALKASAKGQADFTDVADGDWYAAAVAWAVENGVTAGIGDGLFGPGRDCTRAQIVTFLFKAYNP